MNADDFSDFLRRVSEAEDIGLTSAEVWRAPEPKPIDGVRCVFGHRVKETDGYETRAGFVCYGHSAEFSDAG